MNVTSFPADFQCDAAQRELYAQMEARMMGEIKRKARKLGRVVDLNDAVQEGRLTVLKAMAHFDINRGHGSLEQFVARCVNNTFCQIYNRATGKMRMPRVAVRDGDTWRSVPTPLSALVEEPQGFETKEHEGSDAVVLAEEAEARVKKFRMRMVLTLKGRDRDVFQAKTCPSPELLALVRNRGGEDDEPPSNLVIAEHLGITKNAVDYSLATIRRVTTELAAAGEWAELFEASRPRGWAQVHETDGAFVRRVLERRHLDPRPTPRCHLDHDYCQSAGEYARTIERYPWGAVVTCVRGDEVRTCVLEGRFKPRTGEVFGNNGSRLSIPVPWYGELVNALRRLS